MEGKKFSAGGVSLMGGDWLWQGGFGQFLIDGGESILNGKPCVYMCEHGNQGFL